MSCTIHARLDEETEALRAELKKRSGWTDSEIVRQGIKVLAAVTPAGKKRSLRGAGKYRSGVPDLATNKKYMEGFGE
jgi:hypothetical protein